MERLLLKYLTSSGYFEISTQDINLQLLAHPEYPSFKSIVDTLDYFSIENIAVSIPKEHLNELPQQFLTLFQDGKEKQLILILKHNTSHVIYLDQENVKRKVNLEAFIEKWESFIIAIEPREVEKTNKASRMIVPIAIISLVGLSIGLFLWGSNGLFPLIYYALAIAGAYVSFLIVKEDMGFNSVIVQKFCTKYTNTSCTDVLKSSGAKIFKTITLSDLVVSYTATLLFFLTFKGYNNALLFLLGASATPILMYSVFYQWRVLKKWCLLCLGIAGIFSLQFALTFFTFESVTFPVNSALYFALTFGLMLFSWTKLKPVLTSNKELKSSQITFLKFKRNYQLFSMLLKEQQTSTTIEDILLSEEVMKFGNPNARIKIVAITNPLCGFCKASFNTYSKILEIYGDRVQVNFLFNVNPNNATHEGVQITHKLHELYFSENPKTSFNALSDWFENREVKSWQKKYGISDNSNYAAYIEFQNNWCKSNTINYTPATFINNRLFPREYEIGDLIFFIDDLYTDIIAAEEILQEETNNNSKN